jgi:hypothetical protein
MMPFDLAIECNRQRLVQLRNLCLAGGVQDPVRRVIECSHAGARFEARVPQGVSDAPAERRALRGGA